jgi:DNA polymerase-3 subunit delta
MIVKSQEISLKKKDFLLNKVIVLYGENQDLINDLNDQIISLCNVKNQKTKIIFEDDILKKPDDIINYYLNGSLFEENKNINIIKNCSDKILEIINSVKNNIQDTLIIINSEILQKGSKLRQFGEYDKTSICIPCYQETKFDIKKFLMQQVQVHKLELTENQIETILNFSSLKRSKIKETVEKINIYKNANKITDKIIEEICTENDLKKNEEIIDILLSKNEKNINDFISNMSNYEKNFTEIIIILKSFIMKILDIQKMDRKLSTEEKLERYKPSIFWKDKDRIKNILKIWSSKNLEKLLTNLNIIETNFKTDELAQDTQFFYFLTQNLSKISFKNTNNFI